MNERQAYALAHVVTDPADVLDDPVQGGPAALRLTGHDDPVH